jgi:hypothetical protein
MRMVAGENADQVRARFESALGELGVLPNVVGIPAFETGGFLEVRPEMDQGGKERVGRISAVVVVPDPAAGQALGERVKWLSDASCVPDPLLRAFDLQPFGAGPVFGDRSLAHRLIGIDRLPVTAAGDGVNVAIIDEGFDRRALRGSKRYGGGWPRYTVRRDARRAGGGRLGARDVTWQVPGAGSSKHAQMVARNVLAIAPAAKIWDVPLLPDSLLGPPSVSLAEAMFYYLWRDLRDGVRRLPLSYAGVPTEGLMGRLEQEDRDPLPLPEGPWVLVNAWGVLDPSTYDEDESYVTNPENFFVRDMKRFSELEKRPVDLIFAAGNCGEPTPLPRCGEGWTGPGHSILGVNAHPSVLTVGAVRADGVPIGMSAQGPGGLAARWDARDTTGKKRAEEKPDLCAPSGFRENDDASLVNTGTSAAAGVMAGVVAALRSQELAINRSPRPPEEMRELLRCTARKASGQQTPWDPRLGFGIVDAAAALAAL